MVEKILYGREDLSRSERAEVWPPMLSCFESTFIVLQHPGQLGLSAVSAMHACRILSTNSISSKRVCISIMPQPTPSEKALLAAAIMHTS